MGIFFDSVWEAFRNFLRAQETVGTLALDTKDEMILASAEETESDDYSYEDDYEYDTLEPINDQIDQLNPQQDQRNGNDFRKRRRSRN